MTVSPVCVRFVMTMLNVNIASASLTSQYGIIMFGHNNVFREYVPIIGQLYALLLVHGSHKHTLSQRECRRYDAKTLRTWGMIQSWTNVELDSKSPFVRLINQSHRMSNNPCQLSIRRFRCYRPVHSRAVNKLWIKRSTHWVYVLI